MKNITRLSNALICHDPRVPVVQAMLSKNGFMIPSNLSILKMNFAGKLNRVDFLFIHDPKYVTIIVAKSSAPKNTSSENSFKDAKKADAAPQCKKVLNHTISKKNAERATSTSQMENVKGKINKPEFKYKPQRLPADRWEEVLAHQRRSLYTNEPVNITLGMCEMYEELALEMEWTRTTVLEGLSVMVTNEDNKVLDLLIIQFDATKHI